MKQDHVTHVTRKVEQGSNAPCADKTSDFNVPKVMVMGDRIVLFKIPDFVGTAMCRHIRLRIKSLR